MRQIHEWFHSLNFYSSYRRCHQLRPWHGQRAEHQYEKKFVASRIVRTSNQFSANSSISVVLKIQNGNKWNCVCLSISLCCALCFDEIKLIDSNQALCDDGPKMCRQHETIDVTETDTNRCLGWFCQAAGPRLWAAWGNQYAVWDGKTANALERFWWWTWWAPLQPSGFRQDTTQSDNAIWHRRPSHRSILSLDVMSNKRVTKPFVVVAHNQLFSIP